MLWSLLELHGAPQNIMEFCVEVSLGCEYKDLFKKRIRVMECVYIYKYIYFAMGVLFLGLISFTWVALQQICGALVQ
jgi:hypothetical protein